MKSEIDQLQAAAIATQKLVKKLRQLHNRGEATEADLTYARQAVEAIRLIYRANEFPGYDFDGRAAKNERREG